MQVHLLNFDPGKIPWQLDVLKLLRLKFDYKQGFPEILLSGGYGSAKSTLLAHIAVTHCLFNKNAQVAICRRALPDLKKTIFQEILDHLSCFEQGVQYEVNYTTCSIYFPPTKSSIISVSWADRKYKKIRSLKLSGVIIEELTENDDQDFEAFKALKARLKRRFAIKENFLIAATNPDSPEHWAYKYFIAVQPHSTRFVFYSRADQNPFIDKSYIEQLKADLDEISVRRYVYGDWIPLQHKNIYYAYDEQLSFKNVDYQFNSYLPLDISFDFNIGHGKPLSCTIGQYDGRYDTFYVSHSICIETISTEQMLEEIESRGFFKICEKVRIFGDATGNARSTKSILSDYEIIEKFINRLPYHVNYEICVPSSNPPIKERHNTVNSYLKNSLGHTRVFLYKNTEKLREGLRLVSLKTGGQYQEDDSKDYQHVTTALGYWICYLADNRKSVKIKSGVRF